ncbi:unnamed protein product [Gulo gulo]|uniref:Uncharacterized protein n=1 Tax=Gulo gulo TaxID=48420 RepID=A0A9X9M4K7_GULGU|nr:unnamed protein product [Gulo gulo]
MVGAVIKTYRDTKKEATPGPARGTHPHDDRDHQDPRNLACLRQLQSHHQRAHSDVRGFGVHSELWKFKEWGREKKTQLVNVVISQLPFSFLPLRLELFPEGS